MILNINITPKDLSAPEKTGILAGMFLNVAPRKLAAERHQCASA